MLRFTTAAGALVLVHNVYGQAAPASRAHIRFAMLGLALIWFYDLNLYTRIYLGSGGAARLLEWRGVVVALAAPLFALATRKHGAWRVRLSRAATFQSLSLLAHLRLFRADGDPRHRASRHRGRLVVGADDRGACADDRRRHGPHPQCSGRGLVEGQARQASVRASLRLSQPNGCASPRLWASQGLRRRR